MSKGRGWNRGERSDQIQLNIFKKELTEQKAAILARFEELWGLHEQARQAINDSLLYEWDESAQIYLQVGKAKLKALLSGEVRFGWPESRVVQVLGDTLDNLEEKLACQGLALEIQLMDSCLLYMSSFYKLFRAYLGPPDQSESFRLCLRHAEAELWLERTKISFQYDLDGLWWFLILIQQAVSKLQDKRMMDSSPFARNWQREVQKAYLEQLLGWELPASE